MDAKTLPDSHASEALIDQEIARIDAAIELVASDAVLRVTLSGLQFGAQLAPEAARLAARRGVRVRELWPMGDGPVDLVVEAAGG